jgi:hypothetical protein
VSIYKRKSGRYAVMIEAEGPLPYRVVTPRPPARNGRRRVFVVAEFRSETEAEKQLARLIKSGDLRPLTSNGWRAVDARSGRTPQ